MMFKTKLAALTAMLFCAATSAFAGAKITIVTPYLAQPGTQYYVEAFQDVAKENGWTVNVVDTKGDIAAVISRIEDAVNQKVDAIVLNADPGAGHGRPGDREEGGRAGVRHGRRDRARCSSPTSPATATRWPRSPRPTSSTGSAARAASCMFVFDAFPPVQVRGVIADAIFKNNPDIKIIDRVTPDVQDGGIADSRAKMEAILAANPKKGSIAAVWAAWDQPALGALQAIEAAGRARRRHRHHRHGRQSAGARGDRQGRQFRSLDGAGLQGHRPAPSPTR